MQIISIKKNANKTFLYLATVTHMLICAKICKTKNIQKFSNA